METTSFLQILKGNKIEKIPCMQRQEHFITYFHNKCRHVQFNLLMNINTYLRKSFVSSKLQYKKVTLQVDWINKSLVMAYVLLNVLINSTLSDRHEALFFYEIFRVKVITTWSYKLIHVPNACSLYKLNTWTRRTKPKPSCKYINICNKIWRY